MIAAGHWTRNVLHSAGVREAPAEAYTAALEHIVSRPTALRIAVPRPHFAPDNVPTGVVMTRSSHELVDLGHQIHVVTSLPWYRSHAVEAGLGDAERSAVKGRRGARITRVNPFAGDDKRNLVRRGSGFRRFQRTRRARLVARRSSRRR